jgi:YVTN family beta-propeller protein
MQPRNRSTHHLCSWACGATRYLVLALLLCSAIPSTAQQRLDPTGAAADRETRKAYVGLFKDNAVAVVDLATNRVLKTIPIPAGPHGLVITPDGRKVYVSSDGASTVSIIETSTDQVAGTIEVGPNPHGLAISPDGHKVLVSAFGVNQAIVIDTTSDRIVGRIPVASAHNSVISRDGQMAYVGSQQQGAPALVVLDLVNLREVTHIPLDRTPRGLDLSPEGKWLYFTVAGVDAVQVLDTTTQQTVGQIPTGASPHIAVFTPDGQNAIAISQGPGEVDLLEPTQRLVIGTVKVGQTPHWLALSSDGRTAFVTNEGSGDMSIVDVAHRRVLATIPIGKAPRKIAVQPGPGTRLSASPEGASKPGSLLSTDHGSKDVRGQVALTLEADDYYFAPTILRGEPGQVLKLSVENESTTLHNINIPGLSIDRDIPPKGVVEVEVTFPASGMLPFFCKLHAALGMHGELRAGGERAEIHTP